MIEPPVPCPWPKRGSRIRLLPPSVLVTADDVVHGKPHPEPFLQAARRRAPTRAAARSSRTPRKA